MNSRTKTGLIIAFVGVFLVALGIFAVIRIMNFNFTPPAPALTPIAETKIQVAVAVSDIAAGKVLQAEDLTLLEVPVQFAPRDTIDNLDNAIGKILKTDLVQGEMVLQHNLADPTGKIFDIAYVLDETHVLMALPANDLMSSEAIIQRGDIIDILVSYDEKIDRVSADTNENEEGTRQQVTFAALQRLNITAIVVEVIRDSNRNADEEPNLAPSREQLSVQTYLVALDPQDALILKYLKDIGGVFDYVLRAPTSTGEFTLTPVTSEFIKELYGLELLP